MRFRAGLLALALAGCHGAQQKVAVDVAFDVDDDGSATSVKCIASSGGACQIDFRDAWPKHRVLQPGEMRRFSSVGPGATVCVEAEAAALAKCEPIKLAAGYARIRKDRYDRAD
jgi:ferric-dicitrate binding protein FerR (iron transport regulator)